MNTQQASKERNASGSHQDQNESDNSVLWCLPSREWLILRQQDASQFAAIVARFLAKINKTATCWLWTASTLSTYGYGQFTIRDAARRQHHLYAHRVAWVLSGRHIAPGLFLCHRCDVGLCVRPRHLFPGTPQDNMDDAVAKGRMVYGSGARKLSDAAYADILTQPYHRGSVLAKALEHGVSEATVSRIRNGKQGSTYFGSVQESLR